MKNNSFAEGFISELIKEAVDPVKLERMVADVTKKLQKAVGSQPAKKLTEHEARMQRLTRGGITSGPASAFGARSKPFNTKIGK